MRYSYEFKRKAIELFYQGLREVAIVAGINSGQLYQWVHKYKTLGYNGLMNKPKGRIKILQQLARLFKVIKMKKLFLNLEVIDGYPPVSMESIWAEVTEEGYLKVNNIPFYSKEISLGDIVSGIQTEENYLLYDKTIIHSKNSTLRIVFFNENQKFKDKILTKLIDLGCESEAFNVNFYAINIPIQVDIEEIYIFLDEFVETDDLDYDTGYLAQ